MNLNYMKNQDPGYPASVSDATIAGARSREPRVEEEYAPVSADENRRLNALAAELMPMEPNDDPAEHDGARD